MKKAMLIILIIFLSLAAKAGDYIDYRKTGQGKAIILIPGLGCSPDVWHPVVQRLSKQYCCYAINIAGFAGKKLEKKVNYSMVIEEIIELIKKEKLEKPVLIGHSFGGFLTLKMAIKNPEIPSKLVIVDTYPFVIGVINPNISSAQAILQAKVIKEMMVSMTEENFKQQQKSIFQMSVSNQAEITRLLDWIMKSDRTALAEAQFEILASDLRKDLSRITCPTLVLGTWIGFKSLGISKADTINNFNIQYKLLKNFTLAMTDRARHFIMLDDPAWLNTQIENFLAE